MKLFKVVRTVVVTAAYGTLAWKLWSEYGDRVKALAGWSDDHTHTGPAGPRPAPVNLPDDPAIDLPRAVPDPVVEPSRGGEPVPMIAADD